MCYLFRVGGDIQIRRMTTLEAVKLWETALPSEKWVDMPQKTLADAEELRRVLLAQG
jgi:hypothetical protein